MLVGGLVASNALGVIDEIKGIARTVNEFGDIAVLLPTVALTGPVVAPAGTCATRASAVAELTGACTPLKDTMLSAARLENPMP
jgi:hypothetical protein